MTPAEIEAHLAKKWMTHLDHQKSTDLLRQALPLLLALERYRHAIETDEWGREIDDTHEALLDALRADGEAT